MQLAFNKFTALHIIRYLRACHSLGLGAKPRTDLLPPVHDGKRRWSSQLIDLSAYGIDAPPTAEHPLDVAVPTKGDRLRIKSVHNTVYHKGLPSGSFVRLGDGFAVSSPELLFVEMAPLMSHATHLLLGMELCGGFCRDCAQPRDGIVTYKLPPVTSTERIRAFMQRAHWITGLSEARETLGFFAR